MYKLRNIPGGCTYALITLTDLHENAGNIAIESDYGSWGYTWGSMGGNIREFILRTGKGYLMDKFTYGDHPDRAVFNMDKTIKRIKSDIIEARKQDEIEADFARLLYNLAEELYNNAPDSSEGLYLYAEVNCEEMFDFYDWESFPIVVEKGYGLRAFMDEVLPVFKDILRKELEANNE